MMKMRPDESRDGRRGLSTIELLIVVAILLGLSVLAVPLVEMSEVRTREKQLRDALRDTRNAIDRYRAERIPDPAGIVPFYPPSVASLLQPIPPALLKFRGNPGPFLVNIPQNPFAGQTGVFFWDVRDAVSNTTTWFPSVSSATTQFANGVYDIRVPLNNMGHWTTGLDGSKYEDW